MNKKIDEINTTLAKYNAILEDYKQNMENKELLKDAMRLYTKEIIPEIENLRRLKHELNEVDVEVKVIAKTYHIKSTLLQKTSKITDIEEVLGENPQVLKFSKKA